MDLHPFPFPAGSSKQLPALSFGEGKGHLSVNPVSGCGVGCPYCLNLADGIGPERSSSSSVEAVLDTLVQHEEIVRRLKLSLLDQSDPFDATIRPVLRALLEGLAARLPEQLVILTSRLHPGTDLLDWLRTLPLRVSIFVSLGDATGRIVPVTPVLPRLALLHNCRARGLHAVMLLKPLVAEWCDPSTLRNLLEFANTGCDELVVSGLRLTPEIEASLRARNWPVPSAPNAEIDRELRATITEIVRSIPVSEHRSCAVNRRHGVPCGVLRATEHLPAVKACRDQWDRDAGLPLPRIAACRDDYDLTTDKVGSDGYCRLKEAA